MLFDSNDDCIGTFEGNYFNKLKLSRIDYNKPITIWRIDPNEIIYKEWWIWLIRYFHFNSYTIKLNDLNHRIRFKILDIECQTDSRLRKDIRRLEFGDVISY